MAESVTLDSIRRESERRYGNYAITLPDETVVVLRAPLRLQSHERQTLREMQSAIADVQDSESYSDSDVLALLQGMIRVVAEDSDTGGQLVEAIGDDLATLQTMFENYTERTQSGEASHSAS